MSPQKQKSTLKMMWIAQSDTRDNSLIKKTKTER